MYSNNASDLEKVIYFYITWKRLNAAKNVRWRTLTMFLDRYDFDQAMEKIENRYHLNSNQMELPLPQVFRMQPASISNEVATVCKQLEAAGISALTQDSFKQYVALERIKNAYFFFLKGDKRILNTPVSDFVAVVGTRKTPSVYTAWIAKHLPKNKTIVSGLASGADLMGHLQAIANHQKIVIFPSTDLLTPPNRSVNKRKIWDYALKNGLIISNTIPRVRSFDRTIFLKRNKWMAQMSDCTYAVYFDGISGTLGQLLEVSRSKVGTIYTPKEVFDKNKSFLDNHQHFKAIVKRIKAR